MSTNGQMAERRIPLARVGAGGFLLVALGAALWGADGLLRRGLAFELPAAVVGASPRDYSSDPREALALRLKEARAIHDLVPSRRLLVSLPPDISTFPWYRFVKSFR